MSKPRPKYKWTNEGSPRRSQLLHRLIVSKKLRRKLRKDEFVHHINGDTYDNDIENLKVVSPTEHLEIHCPQKYPEFKTCAACGKNFRPAVTKRKRAVTCGGKRCIEQILVDRHSHRKLTKRNADIIREAYKGGVKTSALASAFTLSRATIYRAINCQIKGAN